MPFLYDEAFDYNDTLWQMRGLVNNWNQKVKPVPTDPTADGNGFTIDTTAAGIAVGNGFMYACPLTFAALQGDVVLTCITGGPDVSQVDVGTAINGLTTIDLNETGGYIQDSNGASSTDFIVAGFTVGGYLKVNGASEDGGNDRRWNGYYRITGISSQVGGTNNRLELNATDIVGTPGDHTGQSGIILTPIDAGGAAFTVSGSAGSSGLLLAGQRFVRFGYSVILRTVTDWSAAGNADRVTMTFGDGALTLKYLYAPSTVDFDATGDTIVTDDGDDLSLLGFRVGGAVLVRSATVSANDGVWPITAIDNSVATNDRLTVSGSLTTSLNDAAAELLPMNATEVKNLVVDFFSGASRIQRNDGVSWLSDGIAPGDYIFIADAVDAANNGLHRVQAVETVGVNPDDTIVVDSSLADETGDTINLTGYFVPERFMSRRFTQATDNDENTLRTASEQTCGCEAPLEDTDGNFNTEWQFEAPGIEFGQGTADRIFGGFLSRFDEPQGRFNIDVRGADGYVQSSNFSGQPNGRTVYWHLNQNPQQIVFSMNGEHVRGFVRIADARDMPFYLGWGQLFGAKGQHPYPILIGATSGDNTLTHTSIDAHHRAWFDPASNGTGGEPTAAAFQRVDGTYVVVRHDTGNTPYTGVALSDSEKDAWFTPYTDRANESVVGISVDSWGPMSSRLRRTLGDEYQALPLELFVESPYGAYISPYGVFYITGEAQTSLNTFVQDAVTHVVCQNIFRSGIRDFAAYALD